jgi:hypothetical protein
MRLTWPLAIMPSADQVPIKSSHSNMLWPMWVVLITGSTCSALRAVSPGFLGSSSCWASTVVSYGDGSNSLDTTTGLLWLDVPLTYQWGRSAVLSELGVGGLFEGYRYATSAEIGQLWTNADIPNPYNGTANSASSAYENLIAMLGHTTSASAIYAVLAMNSSLDQLVSFAMLRVTYDRGAPQGQLADPDTDQISTEFGSYLVKDTNVVPIPAALPLFAAGLVAMGLMGWRRRKAAVAA